ncbi:MAG: exosortase/archaeosortase family protein [Myxococcota bacterium]
MSDAKSGLHRFLREGLSRRDRDAVRVERPALRVNAGRERRLRWVLLAMLCAITAWNYHGLLLTVGGRSAAGQTLGEALYDPLVASPMLGALVFVALVIWRRDRVGNALGGAPAWGLSLIGLGLGSGLRLWSHEIGAPDLLMMSFVLQVAGLAAVLGGRELLAALSMPLLALFVVIPLPVLLVHRVIFPMQLGTAALTSFLLDGIGRSHFLAGDQIFTQGIVFQVIEGCSGMKSTLSILLAAVVYAELTGARRFQKALVVLLAVPVGFFANGLRVLALVLGEIPADSVTHEVYGLGMIVVGIVILAMLELLISRTVFAPKGLGASPGKIETPAAAAIEQPSRLSGSGPQRALALGGLCALSLGLSVWLAMIPPRSFSEPPTLKFNIERLPRLIDGRKASGIRNDDAFLGSLAFRHRLYRSYASDGEAPIRVFVGIEDDLDRSRNGLSQKTRIPRSGWLELTELDVPVEPLDGVRLKVRYPQNEILLEHYRMGYAPWARELLSSWLGLQWWTGARSEPALVIRVETDITQGDEEAAELRLRQFSKKVWDWYKTSG